MDILTKNTKTCWKAWVADNKKMCESGKTEAEAVGKLIMAASSYFDIAVLDEDED